MSFEILSADGAARRGRLQLRRGLLETPVFMPVGTYGTVKAMTPEEVSGMTIGYKMAIVDQLEPVLKEISAASTNTIGGRK